MNKDVIYIDVDDDVTAIIGKIKNAKEKVVALVPPKRSGALQSAVNLRLLERMAKNSKKNLVLVTNNQSLVALAASARIPVAKNLQSKPELAEIPALIVDDGDDIIDGSDLPVGELARSARPAQTGGSKSSVPEKENMRHQAIEEIAYNPGDVSDDEPLAIVAAAPKRQASTSGVKKKGSSGKVPSFDSFRKKLVLIIVGAGALGALLIWMFVFAPAATVIITASTSPHPISSPVILGGTAATDFKSGTISSVSRQEKTDEVVEFEATGQKDVGEKATGVLKISKLSQEPYGVPAGTRYVAATGQAFVTQSAATIPEYEVCFPSLCAGSVTVNVVAESSGTSSNGVTGSATGPGGTTGSFQGATSGGTSKIAKVVSAEDIERARGQLVGKSTDDAKKALVQKLKGSDVVVESSFVVDRGEPVSSPAVNQEAADGKAKLTVSTTYTIQAVAKTELESYLKSAIESKIDDETQKIYSTGIDNASLGSFRKDGDSMTVTVSANGSVGPKIDEDSIKEQVQGERYGEVQQSLQLIEGIKDVDVQYSYFWVRTVPNDLNKIKIEFKVNDE